MAIVIRHGSNGAMKSAASVDVYMIPAIKQGRTVVTNLRGVSLQKCYEVFPDLPSDLDVIFVDTETREGKEKMARWFHWVPLGSLIIFDEASSLFPKSWRESDLKKLDYPGGLDAATQDGRPENWLVAFEMQRHYNWDIVLTTPNIKNIRDDIRNTTEMAYRQRSLGKLLSDKFRMFKEVQHDAVKNGTTHSDAISVGSKRISPEAFRLYESTKTGIAQGSNAGKSMLANPKILLLVGVLVLVIAFLSTTGGPSIANEVPTGDVVPVHSYSQVNEVAVPRRNQEAASVPRGDVGALKSNESGFVEPPLSDHTIRILGTFDGETQLLLESETDKTIATPKLLAKMGYAYQPISHCAGRLQFNQTSRLVLCGTKKTDDQEKPQKRGGV